MHYQTCRDLWTRITAVLRPAGDVDRRKQRIRLVLLAGIAAIFWFGFMPQNGLRFTLNNAQENLEETPVLVAKRYIPSFRVIKEDAVEVRRFPRSFIPPGSLNAVTELTNDRGQSVYASVVAIPSGQPLTRTVLIEAGQQQRLAALLHMGRVAVSFDVEKSHSAGGWIQPGDSIAIFGSLPTRLLFSSLPVLAVDSTRVGQSSGDDHDAEKNALLTEAGPEMAQSHIVTVLATPKEASDLIEAREHGPLSLALRAVGDDLPWIVAK